MCSFFTNNALSLIALIVSFVAILLALCDFAPVETDWANILVGVLSILVTALLAWQIFSAVSFEKRISAIRKDMSCEIERAKKTLRNESGCDLAINQSVFFSERGMYQKALDTLVYGMNNALELNNEIYATSILVNMRNVVLRSSCTLYLTKEKMKCLLRGTALYNETQIDDVKDNNIALDEIFKSIVDIQIVK